MANQEHLDILEQGVEVWNQWRNEHPEIFPNLSSAILSFVKLDRINLSDANLSKAILSRSDLRGADLRGANLSEAYLMETRLSSTNLSGADLSEANLHGAILTGIELLIASFADLREANLCRADLSEADLSGVFLSRADLSESDLRGTNLSHTDLSGAKFSQALIGWTVFGNVDLSQAKGLNSLIHRGPSIIGIDTIYRSGGHIPEVFLQKAGIPDTFITYARSLVNKPIDYYTCFISYSSRDQEFAERLYADLQSKGVRCWFAPEDLKIGDHYQQRIDESIRLSDKLILILSEHALRSAWVEREVAAAREKEDREQRPVLFPVRLDDAVMETTIAWAADVCRRWHIGDFTQWKQHDAYRQALEGLLRDLKAETQQ